MAMFLAGIGWVPEGPTGNRLRWTIDPEVVAPSGRFRGLPNELILERAPLALPQGDTLFVDSATFPIPPAWWQSLGSFSVTGTFPARLLLPQQVQAVFFQYLGPNAFLRVWDRPGVDRTLVVEREVATGEDVLLEANLIQELEFFTLSVNLQQVAVLDLFDPALANGLQFETIARVSPRATLGMSLDVAYQRYGAAPTLDLEDWASFQEELIPEAIASDPTSVAEETGLPTPWQQVQFLLAARWEYAVVFGLGFLDGPDAGAGTSFDQIGGNLLQAMGSVAHAYRATVVFDDDTTQRSNLIAIRPSEAFPLVAPLDLAHRSPEVRLYGEDTYTVTSTLQWRAPTRREIGAEIEEEVGPSAIVNSNPELIALTYQSPDPSPFYPVMALSRRFDVRFYDIPLRFRARSTDGWDRVSDFSPWTPQVVPEFIHNPQGPPLQEARFGDNTVALRAQTAHLSFTEWTPDHAVVHTPGSRLEVLRRTEEPGDATVILAEPAFYQVVLNQPVRLYSVPVPPIAQPERFIGGYLSSGPFRAEILRIHDGQFIFEPIADSTHGTTLFEAGQARLQQAPNHPDLFVLVTTFPVANLPHVLEFADVLAPGIGKARVELYAVRVRLGGIHGGIGNTVPALVTSTTPAAPPPFSVELLGVDFYDRTIVRISFLQNLTEGRYALFWAEGNHDEESFEKAAIAGDYGAQHPQGGHHIYELFSLPIPRSQEAAVTFAAQRETDGGYKSKLVLVPTVVPVYVP